ncbi:hypothetical protein LCGC14_2456510 [marine sediment metagenome]|uniref:Uncharacterized protein n=1 Tax=marine sediment metagenome TaxID=412755 RepID=A0A0F9BEJ3_9ZZZZ
MTVSLNSLDFTITCYHCLGESRYRLRNSNNLPKKPEKTCPHCKRYIFFKILKEGEVFTIKYAMDNNPRMCEICGSLGTHYDDVDDDPDNPD